MADLTKLTQLAKSFCLQRVLLYSLIILSCFFLVIPLGLLQTSFDGNCLLYADFVYEHTNSSQYVFFKLRFGPSSVCDYSLGLSVLFSLIYALFMIGGYLFIYFKDRRQNKMDLAHMGFLVHVLVEILVSLLVLVSACTISGGFKDLCDDITNTNVPQFQVHSCSDAQNFHDWRGFDGDNFHKCLSVALAGSWFQFVFWLLQTGLGLWKLWRLNMLPVLPDWIKPRSSSS